jgi:hypothetical protein
MRSSNDEGGGRGRCSTSPEAPPVITAVLPASILDLETYKNILQGLYASERVQSRHNRYKQASSSGGATWRQRGRLSGRCLLLHTSESPHTDQFAADELRAALRAATMTSDGKVTTVDADAVFRVFAACPADIKTLIIDVRDKKKWDKGHIAGSYCIRKPGSGDTLLGKLSTRCASG